VKKSEIAAPIRDLEPSSNLLHELFRQASSIVISVVTIIRPSLEERRRGLRRTLPQAKIAKLNATFAPLSIRPVL
jgi:hypothetical protein